MHLRFKEEKSMGEKRIKDIMARIEEYDRVDAESPLCDAIMRLKENHEKIQAGQPGKFHKTLLVTDSFGKIIGKITIFDMIRALIPEAAKTSGAAMRAYYRTISSRTLKVADEIGEIQQRFKWLHSTFFDLVKEETKKKVKDIMSPVYPLLVEEDNINKAIYVMFRENIRQPMVVRGDEIVGVVSIMDILPELLEIAGDECFLG
jgi:CBS domain-containing protein